jgi:hypothetical protein
MSCSQFFGLNDAARVYSKWDASTSEYTFGNMIYGIGKGFLGGWTIVHLRKWKNKNKRKRLEIERTLEEIKEWSQ